MTTTPEAYVHLSEDQKTLTFYYDTLRAERDGTTWGIRDTKDYFGTPAWTADSASPNTTVLTAVFDASFRDFRPTTTARWFENLQSLKKHRRFWIPQHLAGDKNGCDVRGLRIFDSARPLQLWHFKRDEYVVYVLLLLLFDHDLL